MYVEVTLPSVKFLPRQRMAHSQTLYIRFSFYTQGSLCQIWTKDLKAGSSGNVGPVLTGLPPWAGPSFPEWPHSWSIPYTESIHSFKIKMDYISINNKNTHSKNLLHLWDDDGHVVYIGSFQCYSQKLLKKPENMYPHRETLTGIP